MESRSDSGKREFTILRRGVKKRSSARLRLKGAPFFLEFFRRRSEIAALMNLTELAAHERSQAAATELSKFWRKPQRSPAMIAGIVAAVLFIILLTLILRGRAATLVLDRYSEHLSYPFTIQNLMHLVFFVGLADLYVRWRIGAREDRFFGKRFLPEDD